MQIERQFVQYRHNGWREPKGKCQLILTFPSADKLVDFVRLSLGSGKVIMAAQPDEKVSAMKQFVAVDPEIADTRSLEDRLLVVEHRITDPVENNSESLLPTKGQTV